MNHVWCFQVCKHGKYNASRPLGVNFMEKTISIRSTEITFSIWDLGGTMHFKIVTVDEWLVKTQHTLIIGQREFVNMLPLVCNDAIAILFMFDLSRKSTLNSIKEWYRQARGFNKTAIPFLIGTKYDTFAGFPREEQDEITNQVSFAILHGMRDFPSNQYLPLCFLADKYKHFG